MSQNPCRTCIRINEDKNNATCTNCELRVRYVRYLEEHLDFSATCADGRNLSTNSLSFTRLHMS
jgi:hypothetical protein